MTIEQALLLPEGSVRPTDADHTVAETPLRIAVLIPCYNEQATIGSVVREQGKGNVIRRMFADITADAYLRVDGDDTSIMKFKALVERSQQDNRSCTLALRPQDRIDVAASNRAR